VYVSKRPPLDKRHFVSDAVEATIADAKSKIADPEIAWLFENCYPNTLDTTVFDREKDGVPDTYVITGDIDAMWLRDSSAQVGPYLPLCKSDPKLQRLLAGVVRRQSRNILLDPYANAFYDDVHQVSEWHTDFTTMVPGLHERKWEVDSLCYCVRLAHGYWEATGDASPFDAEFEGAMDAIVRTFREQQKKEGPGPYKFKRPVHGGDPRPPEGSPEYYGTPVKPNGMIASRFRPSDDETIHQFLIPSNFFAVSSLRQMADLLETLRHAPAKAAAARAFADEVEASLRKYAIQKHADLGDIYAFELDGLGGVEHMDDSNVPNLLSLPYLGACPIDDPIYQTTRKFAWSHDNPWFFRGKYEGIGGPHCGPDQIWPMSHIMRILTTEKIEEVVASLRTLKATHAGTGFMHESFDKNNPNKFSRSWFAWANTLFGEMILHVLAKWPEVLGKPL
jgi:meiotically up-regulated gene 157 (Mug157) protein